MGMLISRLIVSTPTGSTAYNMSAGGSLVHTGVNAILLTPICPLSLSFRPLILPEDTIITIKCPKNGRTAAYVSIDGHSRFEMLKKEGIEITKSTYPVVLFSKDKDKMVEWVERVQKKLNWNYRIDQKKVTKATPLKTAKKEEHKEEIARPSKWEMTPVSYQSDIID